MSVITNQKSIKGCIIALCSFTPPTPANLPTFGDIVLTKPAFLPLAVPVVFFKFLVPKPKKLEVKIAFKSIYHILT